MAEPFFSVTTDASTLFAAFDRLGDQKAQAVLKSKSKITADNIQREAVARVRRRTGVTAQGIIVREDYDGIGWVVVAERQQFPNLPLWIEEGTVHQPARPFFRPSVAIEEGPHLRRIAEGMQDAINQEGLGR